VYYCDFARYQNPMPEGPSLFASDANTAYRREALEAIRPLWEETFREDVVNGALLASGRSLRLCGDAIVYERRSDLSLGRALCERFVWARSYARTRSERFSRLKRLVYGIGSPPVLPPLLFFRVAVAAWQRKQHWNKFVGAAPLAALLLCAWGAGECAGYLAASGER
jgi:hypothetical protein